MVVSADQVAATLQLLVPGFIALSVFYWFGLSVKRTDWRWTLWSLVASVPLSAIAIPSGSAIASFVADRFGAKSDDIQTAIAACSAKAIAPSTSQDAVQSAVKACVSSGTAQAHWSLDPLFQMLVAVILAIVVGLAAVWVWVRLARKYPNLRSRTEPLVWGAVLRSGHNLMLKVDDATYVGWSQEIADPVEVDASDLDLYLTQVKMITPEGPVDLDVQGLLVRREDIKWIQVLYTEAEYQTLRQKRSTA
jgi:hypothetical protein